MYPLALQFRKNGLIRITALNNVEALFERIVLEHADTKVVAPQVIIINEVVAFPPWAYAVIVIGAIGFLVAVAIVAKQMKKNKQVALMLDGRAEELQKKQEELEKKVRVHIAALARTHTCQQHV